MLAGVNNFSDELRPYISDTDKPELCDFPRFIAWITVLYSHTIHISACQLEKLKNSIYKKPKIYSHQIWTQ